MVTNMLMTQNFEVMSDKFKENKICTYIFTKVKLYNNNNNNIYVTIECLQ